MYNALNQKKKKNSFKTYKNAYKKRKTEKQRKKLVVKLKEQRHSLGDKI